MSYRDYPDYDRSRPYNDHDEFGAPSYDRGTKRLRSASPHDSFRAYDDDDAYRSWDAKRSRPRDAADRGNYGGGYSPNATRTWDELDPEEKEREWARYDREREWERIHGYDVDPDYRDMYRAEHRADDDNRTYAPYDYERSRVGARSSRQRRWKDPMDSDVILPFRKYAQLLREIGSDPIAMATGPEATQQLYDKYQEYRKAFNRRAMHQFWAAHKDEKWFQEKYGITDKYVAMRSATRKLGRQGKKKSWLDELEAGRLDNVCWDAASIEASHEEMASTSAGPVSTNRLGEKEVLDPSETIELPAEPHQVLIRQIPTEIGREDVEEVLKQEPGFLYVALGEPHANKRYGRMGWAMFEERSPEQMIQLAHRLSQTTIVGQKLAFEITSRPAQAKLKIAPSYSNTLRRLAKDWKQARELVALLEAEDRSVLWKGEDPTDVPPEIMVNASQVIDDRCRALDMGAEVDSDIQEWVDDLLADPESAPSSDTVAEKQYAYLKKSLDLHIDLLRQGYHCDYYSSLLCDFAEELIRRSPRHIRRTLRGLEKEPTNGERLWANNLDAKHKLLMQPNDDEIGQLGGDTLTNILLELAAPYSKEDETEKHHCTVKVGDKECGKPFMGQIYVQKHVLKKHREWFDSITKDQAFDTKYFNNYVRDPQRVMPPLAASERNGSRDSTNGAGSVANPLTARIGGYEQNQNGTFYGSGSLLRIGGVTPAQGNDRGHAEAAHVRVASSSGAQARRYEPLPSQPLDPRAAQAPRSYQDLDAGEAPGSNELDLQY